MKKEDIQLWDIHRILFGQAPAEFLFEVFVRTIVIYLLLMVVLRLLGKRMDGQLTLTEMAVMITFGAIVSVPMQIPDRGILLGVVALICVLIFQRGLNWFNVKNEKLEKITQGTMSILVKDGVLQLDEMHKAGISKQHVFATLRTNNVLNLGKVKRVYFEACGLMSIYQFHGEARPGLSVLPSDHMELAETHADIDHAHMACTNCGHVVSGGAPRPCPVCGAKKWSKAIINEKL